MSQVISGNASLLEKEVTHRLPPLQCRFSLASKGQTSWAWWVVILGTSHKRWSPRTLLAVCFAEVAALPQAAQDTKEQSETFDPLVSSGYGTTLKSDYSDSNPCTVAHQLCDLGTSLPLFGEVGPVEYGRLESLLCQRLDPALP